MAQQHIARARRLVRDWYGTDRNGVYIGHLNSRRLRALETMIASALEEAASEARKNLLLELARACAEDSDCLMLENAKNAPSATVMAAEGARFDGEGP